MITEDSMERDVAIDRFWDQVRRGNCTTTSGLIGIMGAFLMILMFELGR